MSYRHIFVHLDSSEHCEKRVVPTLVMAQRFGAHVTAVFSQVDGVIPDYGIPEGLPKTTAAVGGWVVDKFAQRAREADVRFNADVANLGSAATVIEETTEAARNADLAVIGQHDPHNMLGETPEDLVDHVILDSARPVLVIPYAGLFYDIGRRVLVGWNGTREATRALNDGMPLISGAEEVRLLTVQPPKEMTKPFEELQGRLMHHLKVHGIEPKLLREPKSSDMSVANLLVSRITDYGCDLLVLGGYGHYGFPAVLRGGVTRGLLKQTTVPTLLSH
ncbi:universal stress protein [Caenispirillum salinarum]|uniref:universal stress protein n=1 Tax=Caenispirillum salinarum TaxID=859058 RepID=UPI00384CF83F